MESIQSRFVLGSLMVLSVTAIAILLAESGRSSKAAKNSQEIQQMVGGLGFGPAVDLTRCTFAFDPRIGPVCESQLSPIPGGKFVCPYHACSVFDPSHAIPLGEQLVEVVPDATVP